MPWKIHRTLGPAIPSADIEIGVIWSDGRARPQDHIQYVYQFVDHHRYRTIELNMPMGTLLPEEWDLGGLHRLEPDYPCIPVLLKWEP